MHSLVIVHSSIQYAKSGDMKNTVGQNFLELSFSFSNFAAFYFLKPLEPKSGDK